MGERSAAKNRVVSRGGAPRPLRQWARNALLSAAPADRLLARTSESQAVYLTFDDGPHPVHTPEVLDVLRQHGARATFFCVGGAAERHPDLVRRIAAEGHAVGNHTYRHDAPERTCAEALAVDVRRAADALERIGGVRPRLFRPPHGKLTAAKLWRLWQAEQTVVLWSVDPRDYSAESTEDVLAFFRERPLEGGEIVLLHDVTPHAALALPALISGARARGLRFEPLPGGGAR